MSPTDIPGIASLEVCMDLSWRERRPAAAVEAMVFFFFYFFFWFLLSVIGGDMCDVCRRELGGGEICVCREVLRLRLLSVAGVVGDGVVTGFAEGNSRTEHIITRTATRKLPTHGVQGTRTNSEAAHFL